MNYIVKIYIVFNIIDVMAKSRKKAVLITVTCNKCKKPDWHVTFDKKLKVGGLVKVDVCQFDNCTCKDMTITEIDQEWT